MFFHRSILVALTLISWVASAADPSPVTVTQLTTGPLHHYFGYIGHCQTIPWSADGRWMLALQVAFQDQMPGPEAPADICVFDAAKDYSLRVVDRTHAWNPQQGTMLYWNPAHPSTQFFFNDRDPRTGRVFTVLFDLAADGGKGRRLREYRFDDTPVGNGGVAQNGGYFTAINYARLARLRRVTGYDQAWDWTTGAGAPDDDGVFRIDINTGAKRLIVSFAQLKEALRGHALNLDARHLFINHTLHNRNNDLILFYCRADFENQPEGRRVNAAFTVRPDGSNLTLHDGFIGGHPEWEWGPRIICVKEGRQVIYDMERKQVVETLGGRDIFPDLTGDKALSPDGSWLATSHREGDYHYYTFFEMRTRRILRSPPVFISKWHAGLLRLDAAPAWNRTGDAIAVPGIAPDGTRQMFLLALPR
jgi:hypothetical protein